MYQQLKDRWSEINIDDDFKFLKNKENSQLDDELVFKFFEPRSLEHLKFKLNQVYKQPSTKITRWKASALNDMIALNEPDDFDKTFAKLGVDLTSQLKKRQEALEKKAELDRDLENARLGDQNVLNRYRNLKIGELVEKIDSERRDEQRTVANRENMSKDFVKTQLWHIRDRIRHLEDLIKRYNEDEQYLLREIVDHLSTELFNVEQELHLCDINIKNIKNHQMYYQYWQKDRRLEKQKALNELKWRVTAESRYFIK